MHRSPARALAPLLFLCLASSAGAQTAHLNWDECSAAGTKVRVFACNTNAGSHALVGSVEIGATLPGMHGFTAELVIQADAAAVPSWWHLTACRSGSLSTDLDPPAGVLCVDNWNRYAEGGVTAFAVGAGGAQRVRIRLEVAMDPMWEIPLLAGEEIYLFQLRIDNARTVGTCGGCETAAAIFFSDLRLLSTQVTGGVTVVTRYPESFASWQCPLSGGAPPVEFNCPTRARPRTWGGIQSLYRR